MAQLVSIELKPLVKIRNWNRDCINPTKYSQTTHGSPCPIAPFVANFSMRRVPQAVPPPDTEWSGSPTGRPPDDEMWAVLRTNPRRVREGNVAVVGSKTERQAARALVAAYHKARLADLIEHVAEELDRYRDGEVDAYAVDETIHQYHRAAQELWKFCWSGGVGANTEIVARMLEQLTEAGETVDWWERIPAHRPRRR